MKLTREELYEQVWAEPMQKVAARLEVSDVYLARVCAQLKVPHPRRGYWAQLAAGQKPHRPPLPPPRSGDALEWCRGGGDVRRMPPEMPKPPKRRRGLTPRARASRTARHPLLDDVADSFKESRLTYGTGYYKPRKRRLPDLIVSPDALERGLGLLNGLYLSLEDRGYPVVIGPRDRDDYHRPQLDIHEPPRPKETYYDEWWPSSETVAFLGSVAIGLTLYEVTEFAEVVYVGGKTIRVSDASPRHRRAWAHTTALPSGRFALRAYSPYRGTEWQQTWVEKRPGELEPQLEAICKRLESAAPQIAEQVANAVHEAAIQLRQREIWWLEERRRDEERRREHERQENERQRQEAITKSREAFLSIVDEWSTACRIESLAREIASRLRDLDPEEARHLEGRLERARQLLGSTSALERLRGWRTPEELLALRR